MLPEGVGSRQVLGLSAVAGVGFTMSLFITELAFEQTNLLQQAKVAILFGSLLAAIISALILRASRQE